MAKAIAEGLRKLGQNPQIVKIFSDKGEFLSWQGRQIVSTNNFHVAVKNGERFIDAYTSSPGMTWAEYEVAMPAMGKLQYTVLP